MIGANIKPLKGEKFDLYHTGDFVLIKSKSLCVHTRLKKK